MGFRSDPISGVDAKCLPVKWKTITIYVGGIAVCKLFLKILIYQTLSKNKSPTCILHSHIKWTNFSVCILFKFAHNENGFQSIINAKYTHSKNGIAGYFVKKEERTSLLDYNVDKCH